MSLCDTPPWKRTNIYVIFSMICTLSVLLHIYFSILSWPIGQLKDIKPENANYQLFIQLEWLQNPTPGWLTVPSSFRQLSLLRTTESGRNWTDPSVEFWSHPLHNLFDNDSPFFYCAMLFTVIPVISPILIQMQ